jgi:hypothetical protein
LVDSFENVQTRASHPLNMAAMISHCLSHVMPVVYYDAGCTFTKLVIRRSIRKQVQIKYNLLNNERIQIVNISEYKFVS